MDERRFDSPMPTPDEQYAEKERLFYELADSLMKTSEWNLDKISKMTQYVLKDLCGQHIDPSVKVIESEKIYNCYSLLKQKTTQQDALYYADHLKREFSIENPTLADLRTHTLQPISGINMAIIEKFEADCNAGVFTLENCMQAPLDYDSWNAFRGYLDMAMDPEQQFPIHNKETLEMLPWKKIENINLVFEELHSKGEHRWDYINEADDSLQPSLYDFITLKNTYTDLLAKRSVDLTDDIGLKAIYQNPIFLEGVLVNDPTRVYAEPSETLLQWSAESIRTHEELKREHQKLFTDSDAFDSENVHTSGDLEGTNTESLEESDPADADPL